MADDVESRLPQVVEPEEVVEPDEVLTDGDAAAPTVIDAPEEPDVGASFGERHVHRVVDDEEADHALHLS